MSSASFRARGKRGWALCWVLALAGCQEPGARPDAGSQAGAEALADAPDASAADVHAWRALRDEKAGPPSGPDGAAQVHQLAHLLASSDPELRDAIAFSVLSRWIEAGLEPATRSDLVTILRANLRGDKGSDGEGNVLARSFSALVLSSVLRRDRAEPFLTEDEHRVLLEEALAFFERETDPRGYDAQVGWVHATAHGTDLLRGLARSRFATAAEHERILAATERKVAGFPRTFEAGEERRLAWTLTFLGAIPRERVAEMAERFAASSKAFWARSEPSGRVDPAELARVQNARRLVESLYLALSATAGSDEAVKDRVGRAALGM